METIKIVSYYDERRRYLSEHEVHFDGQVWRWGSNGRIPPKDAVVNFGIDKLEGFDQELTDSTREAEDQAFFAAYRERMKDYVPSGEELAEMKNAFGEGAKVVNVITGKVTQL